MNATLLKRLDSLAGPLLAYLLRNRRRSPPPASPRSALVIRPGGIGDAILLVPALAALKEAFPSLQIDVLAERRNAAAFGLTSVVRSVHRYDSGAGLAAVLKGEYDVVIDTEQWYRLSAVVARLTRAPVLIGFGGNERGGLFTHAIPYPMESYEVLSFFRLLQPLQIALPSRIAAPFLELPETAREEAERLLAPLAGAPFVAVFPGASTREKQWGTDNFRALISHLTGRGLAVVLVGGEDIREAGAELAAGEGVLDLTGRSSLAVSAGVLARGRALVTGDSGLLHIAAGLGTPTVSLFGPSDPAKWGPQGERHLQLSAGLSCAPCSRFGTTPPCPVNARCIRDIGVSRVVEAVDAILS